MQIDQDSMKFASMQMQRNLQTQAMEQPLPGVVIFRSRRQSADSLGEGTHGLPGLLQQMGGGGGQV